MLSLARYKDYNYDQMKMIPVAFDRQILPGSFEQTLLYLIDHELELSRFDQLYRNDDGGRHAYDPSLLLKIIILAYSKGTKEMLKTKYILIAVAIFVIAWIGIRELLFLRMKPALDTMAAQLLRTQSSENVVHIGGSTRSSLIKISKQYPGATWEIQHGNAPRPLGDGSAQACIMYRDGGKELLGLRIRQDDSAFHILGYWTPR